MRPLRRFNYGRGEPENPDESIRLCLWDAAVPYPGERKIIIDETHTLPSRKRHDVVHKSRGDIYYNIFETKTKEWLTERYPDWEDCNGHWDKDDEQESNQEEDNPKEDQKGQY